jgi:hypothetical protein
MERLRLLFWLKWTLTLRMYRRSTSALVGVLLALCLLFPIAVGVALACGWVFRTLPAPLGEQALRVVLLLIYGIWLLTPLLGYTLNDSYDITRLFVYPLSVREIFTGAILGSLIDFTVLLALPTLAAALYGFTTGPAAFLLVAVALGLFLFHTLSISQALLLATSGVLRSRRFRDVLIVAMPLVWITYYVISQALARRAVAVDWRRFLQSPAWEAINLLPPGLAARAAGAAARGDLLASLGFLAGLVAVTVATVYLAGWLVQMAYAGESGAGRWALRSGLKVRLRPANSGRAEHDTASPGPRAQRPERRAQRAIGLPPVVEAVLDKEARYLVRDPYFKVAAMNLLYILFVAVFIFLRPGGREEALRLAPGMVWGASGMVLLSEMQLLFNIFGPEGSAASVLFSFPGSRRQMLIGKNLALFTALSAVNLFFMLIVAVVAGAVSLFGLLFAWMELALVILVAAGNLVSIWFPSRVAMRGWRQGQQSAARGCGYGFLYLGVAAGALALASPILAALLVPTYWIAPAWLALTLPLAVAYAAGIYLLSLRLAEPLLLEREVEIVARLAAD